MEPIWFTPALAEEIMKNNNIFEQTQSVVADILSNRLAVTLLVENMAGILTNKEAENRDRGMRFFTKILRELPKHYLNEAQIKFISKFYVDRLKDNHRVIPAVIEGYLSLVDMKSYDVSLSGEFFMILFREVVCQSQVRQDRYNIYLILQKVFEKDPEYLKTLGPDFVYGVISAMDGERDPRNLLFLFTFLPKFLAQIPLGHLQEEMFDVISCYFPIDFHPSPGDPAAVTRQDLANGLVPCLCALPSFGEPCLVLLVEKLDSQLTVAILDSLQVLKESCNTFTAETYGPFLKTFWSSIKKIVLSNKDNNLKLAAHEALGALVKKLSSTANTDKAFEAFVEGIIISMQTAIAEYTTVTQLVQANKVLLTAANASKESCHIIAGTMIPATIAYYHFKSDATKLQLCSLHFLGDLFEVAKHWDVIQYINTQTIEIPRLCLAAVSEQRKEYQIAGFTTLNRVIDVLPSEFVVPFVEILIHNVQFVNDTELLTTCVDTVNRIAQKYPELIMNLVVKGKCDLEKLTSDKQALNQRLNLLSNLLSIDDFTKIIIEEMLKLIVNNDKEAPKIVEALSESMSNTKLYPEKKIAQIESDHNLINSIVSWLFSEIESTSQDALQHGYTLISNTMSSLPIDKQIAILDQHTQAVLDKCKVNIIYFLILESLYNSIHKSIYTDKFLDIMALSLKLSITCEDEMIRVKACALLGHFLNKTENGPNFEVLYEFLKNYLSSCCGMDNKICPRVILMYGWIAKALVMRGSDLFNFWLQKIVRALSNPIYAKEGAEAIRLIMSSQPSYFTARHHCRISLLYKQRMFIAFSALFENEEHINPDTKESYLMSWSYVLNKAPKSVFKNHVHKIASLVIESLEYNNKDLLLVMIDILCHLVQSAHTEVSDSLQTVLPRLIKLSRFTSSMDVRMKSLQCLYDIANAYRTALLLPYKSDILLELAPVLDDKKRLVRNMAVRARTRWFLIGAPGELKIL